MFFIFLQMPLMSVYNSTPQLNLELYGQLYIILIYITHVDYSQYFFTVPTRALDLT